MAVRRQRLELIARVLEFQREFQMLYGRDPTAEQVDAAIGPMPGR